MEDTTEEPRSARLLSAHHTPLLKDMDSVDSRHSQMQLALLRSEERFRLLTRAVSELVWITDAQGKVTEAPDWLAFTGQSQADREAGNWLAYVHPDDQARVASAWNQALDALPLRRRISPSQTGWQLRLF